MNTVLDRSVPVVLPISLFACGVLCSTEIPGDIRVVTVFNGTDNDGTLLFDTQVYVDEVYDVVVTSFSLAEAWMNHDEIVRSTGQRIYVA